MANHDTMKPSGVFWLPVLGVMLLMLVGIVSLASTNAGLINEAKQISLAGDLTVNQRNAVLRLLSDYQLVKTPITEIQGKLESESWIHAVAVERSWPDTLQITVTPEVPIALWNDDAYLNDDGKVFASPFVNQERLPQLYGPVGKELVVMTQYQQLNNTLLKVGQRIETLTLGPRNNWQFQNDRGVDVLLGKAALMERVQRLLRVTAFIEQSGNLEMIEQIDTRYGNGVAVAWKDQGVNLATNYNSQREAKL